MTEPAETAAEPLASATTDNPRSALSVDSGPAGGATECDPVTQWQHDDDPMPHFDVVGKDEFAVRVLDHYAEMCFVAGLGRQAVEVEKARDEMVGWRQRHPDLIKLPDHDHVPASAAVDAASSHQLRRIGWASIDELHQAYVATMRTAETAEAEVLELRAELATLNRAHAQTLRQHEAATSEEIRYRAERDEARRQLAEIRQLAEKTANADQTAYPTTEDIAYADAGRAILRLLDGDTT